MKKSLLVLASGTLGLGIAEFVMMGILPNVARDLSISIPEAGHFISAYAIGVCVGAPLTVFVARTRPLKQILLGLVAILCDRKFVCGTFSRILDVAAYEVCVRITSRSIFRSRFYCSREGSR